MDTQDPTKHERFSTAPPKRRRYERFLKTAPCNSYAVVDKDGWHLSVEPTEKLDQDGQDSLAHLKSWLASGSLASFPDFA
jgi:hypothetical protein